MSYQHEFIINNKKEYLGKVFLLSNKERNGIHISKRTSSAVIINIDKNGNLSSDNNSNNVPCTANDTLSDILKKEIQLEDLSPGSMFKYLILPEIEVDEFSIQSDTSI